MSASCFRGCLSPNLLQSCSFWAQSAQAGSGSAREEAHSHIVLRPDPPTSWQHGWTSACFPPISQRPPGKPEARSPWLLPAQPGCSLHLILRRPQARHGTGGTCWSRSTFTLLSYRWSGWHLSRRLARVVTLSRPNPRRRVVTACSHAGSFPRLLREDRTRQGQTRSGGEGVSAQQLLPASQESARSRIYTFSQPESRNASFELRLVRISYAEKPPIISKGKDGERGEGWVWEKPWPLFLESSLRAGFHTGVGSIWAACLRLPRFPGRNGEGREGLEPKPDQLERNRSPTRKLRYRNEVAGKGSGSPAAAGPDKATQGLPWPLRGLWFVPPTRPLCLSYRLFPTLSHSTDLARLYQKPGFQKQESLPHPVRSVHVHTSPCDLPSLP